MKTDFIKVLALMFTLLVLPLTVLIGLFLGVGMIFKWILED